MKWAFVTALSLLLVVATPTYSQEADVDCGYYRLWTIEYFDAKVFSEKTNEWLSVDEWLSQFGEFYATWTYAGTNTHWNVKGPKEVIDEVLKKFNSPSVEKEGEVSMYLLRADCFESNFLVETKSTYIIEDIDFIREERKLKYTIESSDVENPLFQVTMPNNFMCEAFIMYVDGEAKYPTETVAMGISPDETFLVYTYGKISNTVEVESTKAAPNCEKALPSDQIPLGSESGARNLIVNLNKPSYGVGDSLIISGQAIPKDRLLVELFNPQGRLVLRTMVDIGGDSNFNKNLLTWNEPNEVFIAGTYTLAVTSMADKELRVVKPFRFLVIPIVSEFPETFSDDRLEITLDTASIIGEDPMKYQAYLLVKNISNGNVFFDASKFYVRDSMGNKYLPIEDLKTSGLFASSGTQLPPTHARGGSLTFVIESGDRELTLYYDDGITTMVVPEFPVNLIAITAVGLIGVLIPRLKRNTLQERTSII